MSYEEFRRRIDTMRQILVGAVPSPAGQIDQITYALMYKFMNDIDDQSAALGGVRTHFTGEYEKYNWHALMSSSLGAHERLELYRQAIQTMAKNENIPELFRSIYQNAFLPFNSANVLTLFLKEADKFSHGETDDIGDAYEYLLSITGAQGDVGQFRTPRHIIKFIAEAVSPTKDDKVLDPAVGTAGFLIAAYNHVRSQHDGKDVHGNTNDEKRLTADELDKIHRNYRGFDIDPTMVRTAKVNMYLHGFKTPDIINHDSLSSEEYWNDRYDVILANPPFMTPKGGIQPHKKFGISANRAEVLFVDYIASHLKPTGRAGIVVPEGIIFQSGKAYKELRKNLVENYLYAVVSLPAGVFQPYSGVKTSVLLFDKELARQRDEILFVKVENDGYSLGAQRRKITGDQFPEALEVIEKFKSGEEFAADFAHTVSRNEVAESGDYNLSGDRYKVATSSRISAFEDVPLGELVDIVNGSTPLKTNAAFWENGVVPWFTVDDIRKNGRVVKETQQHITEKALRETSIKLVPKDSVLLCCTASVGEYAIAKVPLTTNQQFNALVVKDRDSLLPEYLFWAVSDFKEKLEMMAGKTSFSFVSGKVLRGIKIPFPPIEIQREIVAELYGYQKIIDAAQTIVQTYKPTIKISPEWEQVKLNEVVNLLGGGTPSRTDDKYWGGNIKWITSKYFGDDHTITGSEKITELGLKNSSSNIVPAGSTIVISRVSVGKYAYADQDYAINQDLTALISKDSNILDGKYLFRIAGIIANKIKMNATGIGVIGVTRKFVTDIEIPLPPIEIQHEIVAELEAEQQLINANKKLIGIYQQKIKSKIAEVWGE